MKKILLTLVFLLASALPVAAQTTCPVAVWFAYGYVQTPAQWQACWNSKQNLLGYTPVNKAGDTMLGPLTTFASALTGAGFTIPPGIAPSSPIDGNIWTTTAGLYGRINGVTVGPFSSATTDASALTTGTLPAGRLPAFSGDVATSAGSSVTAIGANKVTNAQLAQMAGQRIKGNASFATANVADLTPAQVASLAALPGYINGLTLTAAGGVSLFAVDVGAATDSTNAAMMALASFIQKTTSSWAVGFGNGALDTGTIAINTWYYVFLIQRPDTGVVDVEITLSSVSPALPANYTLFRRIGAMKTDGSSHWIAFSQNGDEFLWLTSVHDMSNVATSATAALQTLTVPPNLTVTADFRAELSFATGVNGVLFTSPIENDQAPGSGLVSLVDETVGSAAWFRLRTDLLARIRVRSVSTNGTIDLWTRGWVDTRGKS